MNTQPADAAPLQDMELARIVLNNVKLPTLKEMLERAVITEGTGYEAWALEALMLALVLQQAQSLNMVAVLSMEDPSNALDQLTRDMKTVHGSLHYLRTTVFFEAARNLTALKKEERRKAKKQGA